jgi:hypothetical protein
MSSALVSAILFCEVVVVRRARVGTLEGRST